MSETLKIDRRGGGIVVMTLCRAPVNAFTPDFLGEVGGALQDLEADPSVRAVVMASAFRVFSAGLDLRETQGYGAAEQTAIVDALNGAFLTMYGFARPLICAVGGAAIAGGLFPALCAHHTVAVADAKMGLSEVRVGVPFPVAPMEIARAELTPWGLRRLMLRGRPVTAETAMQIGIVDEIAAPDDLLDRALAVAEDFAGIPPKAYAAVKAQVRAPALAAIRAAVEDGTDPTRDGWFTGETKAAMRKALER